MAGGGNRRLDTAPRGPLPGGWPGTGTELQPGGGKAASGVVPRVSFPLASDWESSPWRGTLPTPSHSAGQGCLATNGAQQAIREARAGAKVPLTPADLRAWGAEGRARLVALGEGIVSKIALRAQVSAATAVGTNITPPARSNVPRVSRVPHAAALPSFFRLEGGGVGECRRETGNGGMASSP